MASEDVLSSMGFLLARNRTSFYCDPFTHGVASLGGPNSILESSTTIEDFLQEFQDSTALSVELWVTPLLIENDHHSRFPILTFGQGTQEASSSDEQQVEEESSLTDLGCDGYDLQISQRNSWLEVSYTDHDLAQSCRVIKLRQRPLIQDEQVQLVLVLDQGATSVYMNGDLIIDEARNYFLDSAATSTWSGDDTLQLFSNALSDRVFPGSMHKVAFYKEALNHTNVLELFEAAVPEYKFQEEEPEEPIFLVAEASADAVLVQGRTMETPISIGTFNTSTFRYDLAIEIVSLPSFGNLVYGEQVICGTGFRIPLEASQTHFPILYDAYSEEYFNTPTTSFSGVIFNDESVMESFEFRIVAIIGESNVVAVSEAVSQDIHVVHVNHAPILHAPLEARLLTEHYKDIQDRPRYLVGGIQLKDAMDKNIDRVRVDVWAANGTIQLWDEHLDLADFESCAGRPYSVWQCFGDGQRNRNMTFLAEPEDVALILKNMLYTSFFWGANDTVIVRVFDGSGGSCLDELEHQQREEAMVDPTSSFFTIHEGCFSSLAEIHVEGLRRGDATVGDENESYVHRLFDFQHFGIPDVLFWGFVILVLMAWCFCCCLCIQCFRRRGAKLYPLETLVQPGPVPALEQDPQVEEWYHRHRAEVEELGPGEMDEEMGFDGGSPAIERFETVEVESDLSSEQDWEQGMSDVEL